MMRTVAIAALFAVFSFSAQAAVKGEAVEYQEGGVTFKGYLAYDDAAKDKRPGVLVVHEWWGHNEYARKRADMLAELGYVALAVDMYGDGKVADHPKQAGEFSGEVKKNIASGRARFNAAWERLNQHPGVDTEKTAAIGYCFGGGVVLEMARSGADLDGVASFHGSLDPIGEPAKEGDIKAPILVLHGADDKFIPAEVLSAFKQEMADAKADMKFVAYPNALHAFTNPDAGVAAAKFQLPLAYNEAADKASWQELQDFFAKIFK